MTFFTTAGDRAYDTLFVGFFDGTGEVHHCPASILQSQSENIQTGMLTHSASGISCQVSEGAGQFPEAAVSLLAHQICFLRYLRDT